jgi:hypothetical protein
MPEGRIGGKTRLVTQPVGWADLFHTFDMKIGEENHERDDSNIRRLRFVPAKRQTSLLGSTGRRLAA